MSKPKAIVVTSIQGQRDLKKWRRDILYLRWARYNRAVLRGELNERRKSNKMHRQHMLSKFIGRCVRELGHKEVVAWIESARLSVI